jgi:hypothetical protein
VQYLTGSSSYLHTTLTSEATHERSDEPGAEIAKEVGGRLRINIQRVMMATLNDALLMHLVETFLLSETNSMQRVPTVVAVILIDTDDKGAHSFGNTSTL